MLCDTTGENGACASSGGNSFDGGAGADKLWYEITATSSCTSVMDTSSTSGTTGADNDTCGDDSDWVEDPDVNWPDDCETPSNVIPTFCDAVIH